MAEGLWVVARLRNDAFVDTVAAPLEDESWAVRVLGDVGEWDSAARKVAVVGEKEGLAAKDA